MFDFEDELTVGSYEIPWLIWIQLLVMLLLIVLLYFFSTFALDPSDETATATTTVAIASTSTSGLVFSDVQQAEKPVAKHHSRATAVINAQGEGEKLTKGETATGASRRIVSKEEITEEEEEALYFHPCHYFNIARLAFLKCLGLDPTSDAPSTQKRQKRKQS